MGKQSPERQWPILLEGDLPYLKKMRAELAAKLDADTRWTELMRRIIGTIPQKEDGTFGQDVLGKNLLKGIPIEGLNAVLNDTGTHERLQSLLSAIDQRVAELMQGEPLAGEIPLQQQKPAA